jgi:hypothetical protein
MSDTVKSVEPTEIITKAEAAAEQGQSLEALIAVAAPLIQQCMDTHRATEQDKHQHEQRLLEIKERMQNRFHGRLVPLYGCGALVIAGVIFWACAAGKWEIVTHLLTAVVAGWAGWAARSDVSPPPARAT